MKEHILQTDKGKVFYWQSDNWDVRKDTLFFLHGLTADHSMFDGQIPAFEKEYNLLTWDTPAHGKSRPFAGFDFAGSFRRRMTVAADVVAKLFLVDAGDAFKAGKREGSGIFLKEGRDIVFEGNLCFHKGLSCLLDETFHFLVARDEIFLGLLDSGTGPNNTIRIGWSSDIDGILAIPPSFDQCCNIHTLNLLKNDAGPPFNIAHRSGLRFFGFMITGLKILSGYRTHPNRMSLPVFNNLATSFPQFSVDFRVFHKPCTKIVILLTKR